MDMHVRPIVSALWRNRTGAILVALQIAIALTVLVNAVYIVKQRVDKIGRPTGIDVENIIAISSSGFSSAYAHEATIREDLDYLRNIPGVLAVTPTSAVPFSGSGSSTALMTKPEGSAKDYVPANYMEVDHDVIRAYGLRIVAGRNFEPSEILPPRAKEDTTQFVPQIIVSQALAKKLFPDDDAVGKVVYSILGQPATIIGVVERMYGPWVSWDQVDQVFFMPRLPYPFYPGSLYVVRTHPGQLDTVLRKIEAEMPTSNPNRIINWIRPLQAFKDRAYRGDRNMGIFLVTVTTLLLGVTLLGIFGLATFNVSTRTKQIGTRRAIGARRTDIVRYFLVENWLITTAGVVVGSAAALAVGYWLSVEYELARLDLYYLVGGILLLWLFGLLAAWQPARRAAAISPAIATRTV